jgi:hypothetical protein
MRYRVFFIQIATVVVCLFGTVRAAAQPREARQDTIRGIVLSATQESQPIPGATIQWLGAKNGVFTNKDGRFAIVRPSGDDSLICRAVGFQTVRLVVSASGELTITLEPESMSELRLEAESGPTITKSPFKTETISKKDLTKAACCSLAESFEKNPSVEVSFADAVSGAKQIQLLGLRGVYTQ